MKDDELDAAFAEYREESAEIAAEASTAWVEMNERLRDIERASRSPGQVMANRPPRWKDYLHCLWCLSFDWLDALSVLYRSDKHGPLVWIGERAQVVWFITHNNRIYDWLDASSSDESS